MNLETLSAADFEPSLGKSFMARLPDGSDYPLTLVEVQPLESSIRPGAKRAAFSLVFRGTAGQSLPQRIYEIVSDSMGSLTMFLVPMQPDAAGSRYEAIFN